MNKLLALPVLALLLQPIATALGAEAGATFRGLSFTKTIREQLPECPKAAKRFGSRHRDVYPVNRSEYSATCWERHIFCVLEVTGLASPIDCDQPWLVAFVDGVNSTLPIAALVEEADGKLQALTFGASESITIALLKAQTAETRASTAAMLASRQFNRGKANRLSRNELMALAQAADDREADKSMGKIAGLYVKAVGVALNFPTEKAGEAEDLFRAKYGKPSFSAEESWQSKGGVSTNAIVRTWKWKGLALHMKAPDTSVDDASLVVATGAYIDSLASERSKTLRKGLDDL